MSHTHIESGWVTVLPLAELPESMALVTGGRRPKNADADYSESGATSSSWRTLSSNASRFSHVSQDSLGLAEALVDQGAVSDT